MREASFISVTSGSLNQDCFPLVLLVDDLLVETVVSIVCIADWFLIKSVVVFRDSSKSHSVRNNKLINKRQLFSSTYTTDLDLFLDCFSFSSLEFFRICRLSIKWYDLLRNQVTAILMLLVFFNADFLFLLFIQVLLISLTTEVLHGFTLSCKLSPSFCELSSWFDVWRW